MNAEIFEKLAKRYKEKGFVLQTSSPAEAVYSYVPPKYTLIKGGKVLRTLNAAELLEDAKKRGCIRS